MYLQARILWKWFALRRYECEGPLSPLELRRLDEEAFSVPSYFSDLVPKTHTATYANPRNISKEAV